MEYLPLVALVSILSIYALTEFGYAATQSISIVAIKDGSSGVECYGQPKASNVYLICRKNQNGVSRYFDTGARFKTKYRLKKFLKKHDVPYHI